MKVNVISSEQTASDHQVEFVIDELTYTAKVYFGKWGVDVDWFKGEQFVDLSDRDSALPAELNDLDYSDWEELLFNK